MVSCVSLYCTCAKQGGASMWLATAHVQNRKSSLRSLTSAHVILYSLRTYTLNILSQKHTIFKVQNLLVYRAVVCHFDQQ